MIIYKHSIYWMVEEKNKNTPIGWLCPICFSTNSYKIVSCHHCFFDKKEKKYNVTIDDIKKETSYYYGLKEGEIDKKSNKRRIVQPRQVASFLARSLTNFSLQVIGNNIGGKDHSNVYYSIETINNLMETDEEIKRDVKIIMSKLKKRKLCMY